MTQKRIARAAQRRQWVQRDKAFIAATRAYWDEQEADFSNLVDTAVSEDDMTSDKSHCACCQSHR